MKQITAQGGDLIRPRDVIKHCGYPTNSKEASGISKTMQRMKNNYELIAGFKYGTYRLPEDVKVDEEQYKDSFRTIEKKKLVAYKTRCLSSLSVFLRKTTRTGLV